MSKIKELRAQLKRCRDELEYIDGMLGNERIMESADLSELSEREIEKFEEANEKLMTEVILLETMLEEVDG